MFVLALIALLILAATASIDDVNIVCSYLHDEFPNFVAWDPLNPNASESIANSSLWTETTTGYWNRRNTYNRPTCVFFPASVEQVSAAVVKLNEHPSVPFGLKSGGHQFNFGFSSVDSGVLFSFEQNMGNTVRSADGESFEVGPGARWGNVYEVTHRTNQIVVGGRLANIGVGGFILGGGLSYYSAQYGLACDNVVNFETVLPNGTVANANTTSHPDLFWALKGGGNRFAIVTKYTLVAHPEGVNGQIWGGTRLYSPSDRSRLFSAIAKFTRDYPDGKAAVIPTHNYALSLGLVQSLLVFFFYDGPKPPANVFADFDAITSISDSTKTRTYLDMANEAGGATLRGFSTAARVNTFPNLEIEDMTRFYHAHWDIFARQSRSDLFNQLDIQTMTWTPQPVSVRIAIESQRRGGNALDLNPTHGDRIWVENSLLWANPICDTRCDGYLRDTADKVKEFQQNMTDQRPTNFVSGDVDFISNNPLFMNDAAFYQDVYASYGSTNEARLRSIQRNYDPNGFMYRQDGGWDFHR